MTIGEKFAAFMMLSAALMWGSVMAHAQAAPEAATTGGTTQTQALPGATQAGTAAQGAMNSASQAAPPAAQTPAPDADAAAANASQQNLPEQGAAPLRVMVGKSLLVNTAEPLRRVSVTDPAIADAMVVTPTQVLIHGRAPGEVTLLLWDANERTRSFDLRVDVDITAANEEIHSLFPDQTIHVTASRGAIVLSGHVADKEMADHAGMVASAYSKDVINVLNFGPASAQEVLLEVKFAEVDRIALTQLGLNIISTGAAGNMGQISTQQFGGQYTENDIKGAIGAPLTGSTGEFKPNDLLNIFLFRPDVNLGAIIKALQQKNIIQILAEPNLIALNGKEASFLAGGEFPYPIVQQGGGFNSITVQFKEFGVRLKFTPLIMPNGDIRLKVAPEVSSLDYTNSVILAGTQLPAISTRRAETEFQLQNGQSFIIAGLMDNRVTSIGSKLPGLGDIPILGNLFRSKNLQKTDSELMVLVTAKEITAASGAVELPKNPIPFLNPGKFDAKPAGGSK